MPGPVPSSPSTPKSTPPAGSKKPADFSGDKKPPAPKQGGGQNGLTPFKAAPQNPQAGGGARPQSTNQNQNSYVKPPQSGQKNASDVFAGPKADYYNRVGQSRQDDQLGSEPNLNLGGGAQKSQGAAQQAKSNQPQKQQNTVQGRPQQEPQKEKAFGSLGGGLKMPTQGGTNAKEELLNQGGSQLIEGYTKGAVKANVGTIVKEKSIKSVLDNVQVLGIKLRTWLKAILATFIIQQLLLLMVLIIMTVAVCQAVSTKVFGFDLGLTIASSAAGFDVAGMCNEVNSIVGGGGTGGTTYSGGTCEAINDPASGCDVEKLRAACDWDPNLASQICNKESGGGYNPAIGGTADYCYPDGPNGRKLPMSIGYFQINIFNSTQPEFLGVCTNVLNNEGCWVDLVTIPGTGVRYCPKRKCSFGPLGENGYNQCVQALSDPVRNTRQACNLYKTRGFSPWSAAKVCKIIQ